MKVRTLAIAAISLMVIVAALGLWVAPRVDGAIDWTKPMIKNGWMAWTLATATFFYIIAALLITFTLLGIARPETPRTGILRIETTRGDRLFISLLGSAFINLAWLGLSNGPQWAALIICLIYAAAVFRWV